MMLFFNQILIQGMDPARAKIGHRESPHLRNPSSFFRQDGQSYKPNAQKMILNHVGRSIVTFGFIPKLNIWNILDVFFLLRHLGMFSCNFYGSIM